MAVAICRPDAAGVGVAAAAAGPRGGDPAPHTNETKRPGRSTGPQLRQA